MISVSVDWLSVDTELTRQGGVYVAGYGGGYALVEDGMSI